MIYFYIWVFLFENNKMPDTVNHEISSVNMWVKSVMFIITYYAFCNCLEWLLRSVCMLLCKAKQHSVWLYVCFGGKTVSLENLFYL